MKFFSFKNKKDPFHALYIFYYCQVYILLSLCICSALLLLPYRIIWMRWSISDRRTCPLPFRKLSLRAWRTWYLNIRIVYLQKKNVKLFRYKILDYWQGANSDKQRSSDMYHLQKFMIRK